MRSDGHVSNVSRDRRDTGQYCVGRRPRGLIARCNVLDATELGRYLAGLAHLEASSIAAFRQLAEHLRAHGAPSSFIARAERSAHDEVRHAMAMGALARREGAETEAPAVLRRPIPSLLELAIDNAIEGCVRETLGALSALWQAQNARDERVRAVMRIVAIDETRHAELAWDLAAWFETRLSSAERRIVAAARASAIGAVLAESDAPVPDEVHRRAGVPTPPQARRMIEELAARAWT